MPPVRNARIVRREGHPVSGATQSEGKVERGLQHATVTDGHDGLILVPVDESGQGAADADEEFCPALAARGERPERVVRQMGGVRAGVARSPLIPRQPVGLSWT